MDVESPPPSPPDSPPPSPPDSPPLSPPCWFYSEAERPWVCWIVGLASQQRGASIAGMQGVLRDIVMLAVPPHGGFYNCTPDTMAPANEQDEVCYVPDVVDPQIQAKYLALAKTLADAGTLNMLIRTYSDSVRFFHEHHRAHFNPSFNALDQHLVFPPTSVGEGGWVTLSPVPIGDMIDTRTDLSVRETLRLIKVYLRDLQA